MSDAEVQMKQAPARAVARGGCVALTLGLEERVERLLTPAQAVDLGIELITAARNCEAACPGGKP